MTRTRILPAAAVLVAVLAGCSSGSDNKTPAASASSVSPSPSGPDDKASCRAVTDLGNAFDFDPTKNQKAAGQAALSKNPGIAKAGAELADAAGQAAMTDGAPEDNLKIAQAQLAVAEACASLFGDNGW